MSRAGLVASAFVVICVFLLSPVSPARASLATQGRGTGSFDRMDLSGGHKIALDAVSRRVSTDGFSKIEAIRRMGARSLLRTLPHHDLIAADDMEKLAESTAIPVRAVMRNGAFAASFYDGQGRAPPGIDL